MKYKYIIGIDEAGRGPLAGPVAVGAVMFSKEEYMKSITDTFKRQVIKSDYFIYGREYENFYKQKAQLEINYQENRPKYKNERLLYKVTSKIIANVRKINYLMDIPQKYKNQLNELVHLVVSKQPEKAKEQYKKMLKTDMKSWLNQAYKKVKIEEINKERERRKKEDELNNSTP